jgi:hypothetical protein
MAPFKIRGIWIADCSHLGASGVLNENIQGDDRESNISYTIFIHC